MDPLAQRAPAAEILAASQPLQLPGGVEQRILTPMAVDRLAKEAGLPRWELEAQALEQDVSPLHYLRNLARFRTEGQVKLLRSTVTVIGDGGVAEQALEILALHGVGRLRVRVPAPHPDEEPVAQRIAERLAGAARNRNASCGVDAGHVSLKADPRIAIKGADAVSACLEDSMSEQLLQFACRMAKLPLVLTGAEADRCQMTTVYPGDAGVALLYKPTHPHLEPRRQMAEVSVTAALRFGLWMAEQTVRVLLSEGDILQGRLLYADLSRNEIVDYPLGG
jgi:molybdopterin/thiamine biosynthesis adenylyltransferase